jgi:hypothetical protein
MQVAPTFSWLRRHTASATIRRIEQEVPMKNLIPFVAGIALSFPVPSLAEATTIVSTLPDFNGITTTSGFPLPPVLVGTFVYTIPNGEFVTSATLSGTWGTQVYPFSTAGTDLYLDGVFTGQCVPFAENCWIDDGTFRPFSFSVPSNVLPFLNNGNADLSEIQTNEFTVRLGTPTLTLVTAVPAPQLGSISSLLITALVLIVVRAARHAGNERSVKRRFISAVCS